MTDLEKEPKKPRRKSIRKRNEEASHSALWLQEVAEVAEQNGLNFTFTYRGTDQLPDINMWQKYPNRQLIIIPKKSTPKSE